LETCIALRDIEFIWPGASAPVLKIPELTIARGEHVFLLGPSGSGKSTLINLLAGISRPQRGDVDILGQRISHLSGSLRDRFRADHIGLIFQQFNLLPYLSVLENTLLPCQFSSQRRRTVLREGELAMVASRLLSGLGLAPQLLQRPVASLSVGQQQRVAVARALIGAPELIIADEPTSALDADSRDRFIELLFSSAGASQSTIIFVSHDQSLSRHFNRVLSMREINTAPSDNAEFV
jgi:putative ABC transport system ATP-binding protein